MSLLLQSDLSAANGSKAIAALSNDMDDTRKLLASVEGFISGSTEHLKGESFDTVRSHMQVYVDALNARIKVAENLISAIKSANSTMSNYMDGEPRLDTSELESVKHQWDNLKATASSYLSRYNNYNAEKERISREALYGLYTETERQAKLKEKKYNLLDKLDSTDSATYSKLQSSTEDISTFKGTVGGIKAIKVS